MEKIIPISKKSATTDNYSGGKSQCSKIEYIYPNLKIGIIIPAYNEEKNIGKTLSKIPSNLCEKIDIIVVDDGSTDKTYQIAESYPNTIVLKHYRNRGYGAAICTGLDLCRQDTYDVLVTLDADGQHRPEEIYNFIEPIFKNEADLVIGSRYLGKCNFRIPFYKRLGEKIIEKVLKFLFNQNVSNSQNGYRAFNRKIIDIIDDIKFMDYTFCTEVLLKAGINGYCIKEIPIIAEPREHGTSKVNLIKILIPLFSCLIYYFIIGLKNKIIKN